MAGAVPLGGSSTAGRSPRALSPVGGARDADDDVPMFSRVTDDFITGGGSLPVPAGLPGINVFGGSGDGVGGGGGGGKGIGGAGGEGWFGDWDPQAIVDAIWKWLPTALALSLALPPAAVQQLIQVRVLCVCVCVCVFVCACVCVCVRTCV